MTINTNLHYLISNLKNASKHQQGSVKVLKTKFNKQFLNCLLESGYINSFIISSDRKYFIIEMRIKHLMLIFSYLRIISKSSRRVYLSFFEISKKYKSTDFFIVSTSKGLFLGSDVFFYGLGGEILVDNLNYK